LYKRSKAVTYAVSTSSQPASPGSSFTVDQTLMPSADQNGLGVVYLNGTNNVQTGFQVLTRAFVVPALDASLTVTVVNGTDGLKAIADAVYVRRVGDVAPSPLTADSSEVRGPSSVVRGPLLTDAQLSAAVSQAAAWWEASGRLNDRQLAVLGAVDYAVADLPGAQLGLASPGARRIWIDRDGAGLGWETSFGSRDAGFGAGDSELAARDASYDLLTAVLHELGHVLGYDHDDEVAGDVMRATLRAGDSQAAAADALFADW
jgi:hypothetical protein